MGLFTQERRFHPDVQSALRRATGNPNILGYCLVAIFSIIYYLAFHGAANLHDISHYIVNGVAMARDHSNLIYPYSSMDPEGGRSAYTYFQENGNLVSLEKSYPSRLYSVIFALYYLLTGTLRFYVAHAAAIISVVVANLLLYAIASRFFSGIKRAIFILAIAFMPLMNSIVYPGNDAIGYCITTFLLWAILSSKISFMMLGVVIGIGSQFRSQLLFLLIFIPFLSAFLGTKKDWIRNTLPILIAGVATYIAIDIIIGFIFGSKKTEDGGGITFYLKFFMQSFYGPREAGLIGSKLLHNFASLSDKELLFVYFFTALLALCTRNARIEKGLALTGLLIVAAPMTIYSLDRYSYPQARYYATAIPFFALSWFLLLERAQFFWAKGASAATAIIITATWMNLNGNMLNNITSMKTVTGRMEFLDFKDADTQLNAAFMSDDLLITNHALPSGLASLHAFIPYPSYSEFKAGDNREINGIVFIYADTGVNEFFRPVQWMVNNSLPENITDDKGVNFTKVINIKSTLPTGNGDVESEAYFVAYKNSSPAPKSYDASGSRVYKVSFHPELSALRIQSPAFDTLGAWTGHRNTEPSSGLAQITGPGSDSTNILTQRFQVKGGETLKLVARAASGRDRSSRGRLQINWLDKDDHFIKADISVFTANKEFEDFGSLVKVPNNAKSGTVFVTPHAEKDIIKYESMAVYGIDDRSN